MNEHYPFELKPLPYEYNALEPYIDEETMRLHHDKHLKTYVDNLNNILKNYPRYQNWSLEKILLNIFSFPFDIQVAVRNNAGGVYNHNMFFDLLEKNINVPIGNFSNAIMKQFGSIENFLKLFKEKALSVFGSGYAFLVLDRNGRFNIITTKNQDTPIEMNLYPVLVVDVWEHAYYLKYNNRRKEYLDNFSKVINWNKVEERYTNFFNPIK